MINIDDISLTILQWTLKYAPRITVSCCKTAQGLILSSVAAFVMTSILTCAHAQGTPKAWGYADLHSHPASHLGFGADENGNNGIMWGKPGMEFASSEGAITTDLPPCLTTHTVLFPLVAASPELVPLGLSMGVLGLFVDAALLAPAVPVSITNLHGAPKDYVQWETQRIAIQELDGVAGVPIPHHSDGAPGFGDWPSALLVEHQQMHITAIRHAFDGGLRLMIADATDNQLLSTLWSKIGFNVAPSVPNPDPNFDFIHAATQLSFIHSLASANSSWIQIVKTPAEAREAIQNNKLAVILGLEMDSLTVDQMLALTKSPFDVRHIIPIHLANNSFGGSAVYNDLWNTNNWFLNNHQFVKVDFDYSIGFNLTKPQYLQSFPGGALVPLPISDSDYSKLGYDAQGGGHKNDLGISDPGAFKRLMEAGLLIDVAHMSEKATEMAITQAEVFGYPLMDSHTGIRPVVGGNERSLLPAHALRIGNLGGVIGLGPAYDKASQDPISDFLKAYRSLLPIMGGRGVALGTDANGLQPLIPGTNDNTTLGVIQSDIGYPVKIASQMAPQGVSLTPLPAYKAGTHTYDLKADGLANYAMVPDFVQAIADKDGTGTPSIVALFHSAEDTIQMWEKVIEASANAVPPTLTCQEPGLTACITTAENQASNCFKQAGNSDPKSARCDANLSRDVNACDGKFCQPTPPTQLRVKERLLPSMDAGRFTLTINQTVETGNTGDLGDTGFVNVKMGPNIVKEGAVNTSGTQLTNYIVQFGGDCPSSDTSQGPNARTVNVSAGQQKTCTITNLGFPALRLQFINTAPAPGNFNIQLDQTNVSTSATANGHLERLNTLTTASHQVSILPADSATNIGNYGFQFGLDCAAAPGSQTAAIVTLAAGDEKVCRITVLAAGVGGCPVGKKPCGDAPDLPGDPEICVDIGGSCDALCKPNNRGVPGKFCEIGLKGAAICAYPPALCP